MDIVNKIKKAHRDGESINEIAKKRNCSWATVKKLVDTPTEKLESRGKRSFRKGKVVTPEVEKSIEIYFEKEELLGVAHIPHQSNIFDN